VVVNCPLARVDYHPFAIEQSRSTFAIFWFFDSLRKFMRSGLTLLLAVACSLPAALEAQSTAYSALKAIGSTRGQNLLTQVVSVRGSGGRPQPGIWLITISDPAARGGIREFEVSGDKITAERTPVRADGQGSRAIDANQLNLDSDGACKGARDEAAKKNVAFDHVNYLLSADSASGKPVWNVDLYGVGQQLVGTIRIGADDGILVSSNWNPNGNSVAVQRLPKSYSPPLVRSDNAMLDNSTVVPNQSPTYDREYRSTTRNYSDQPQYQSVNPNHSDQRQYQSTNPDYSTSDESLSGRTRRYNSKFEEFAYSIKDKTERTFRRVGGWIQKKITGEDTISRPSDHVQDDEDQSDDNNSSRNAVHPQHPD
jgi:hypothetical protein